MKKRKTKTPSTTRKETRSQRREREYRERMGEETPEDIKTKPSEEPVKIPVPIPEGLKEILASKSKLQLELRRLIKKAVMVSIDTLEGEWVYVVRGAKPPFSYWNGHKILFYRGFGAPDVK